MLLRSIFEYTEGARRTKRSFKMHRVSFLVSAVLLLTVEAQDPAARTYGSHHHGHQPHPSSHHPGHSHVSAGHHHQLDPLHPHVLQSLLQGSGHQLYSVPAQAASNANTVPLMVCRIIQVPLARAPPSVVPKADSSSKPPQHVFQNIPSSIGNVVSRVMNPVVSLLNNAFNRTSHREHGHNAHHPHNFTALNHTADHGQGHSVHHHRNLTAPKEHVVQEKLPTPGKMSPQPPRRCSRITSRPAVATETTATPSSAPVVTSAIPTTELTTRANSSPTVTTPVLKSKLCGYAPTPSVPVPRAYPFTALGPVTTSTDVPAPIPEESTAEIPEGITAAASTVLPTTSTAVSPSLPEDRAQGTASTLAAATLLAQSTPQPMPLPSRNEPVVSTYSPASDNPSSGSFVVIATSAVNNTVQRPTSVPVL
ncbi:mucin-7-like [Dermacentor albipictus]|uniref:mucin-7-like n=1 Tax=Dermacentor albipictus TaxID=60249 RepID=UPI0038FCDDE6